MEKHSKISNLIKGIIIVVLAAVIVTGLSKLLVLKSEDGINQMQALYKQPADSIDAIFLGSSLVYCDICPGVMWDNYGISAFDLGGAEAPSWVSYYMLKEALKTQHPKVICAEVSIAGKFPTLYQTDEWAGDNNYGMRWNSNRIDQLRANTEEDRFRMRLNPFNIMHGRYNDLEKNDFLNVRDTTDYKGFDPREIVIDTETPDMSDVTDIEPCSEKAEEYTRKIIELGRQEGIPVILIVSPRDIEESEMRVCNYMKLIADSEGVDYYNFNLMYDELGLDFSKDMSTGSHLSYSGNYKYSDYLGKMLKEKYGLPDHKGDPYYDSWERDARLARFERNDLDIQNSDSAVDVLNMTAEGYILYVVNNSTAAVFVNNKDVASQVTADGPQDPIRLPYSTKDESFLLKEYDNKGEHMLSFFVDDKEYIEYYGNIIFVYDAVRHEYVRSIYF